MDSEGLPARNAFSGNTYKGLNQMLLSYTAIKKDYPKNQWMTFNQIRQKGGTVSKGEKSTSIYFWKFLFFQPYKLFIKIVSSLYHYSDFHILKRIE